MNGFRRCRPDFPLVLRQAQDEREILRPCDPATLRPCDKLRTQDSGLGTRDSGLGTRDSGLRARDEREILHDGMIRPGFSLHQSILENCWDTPFALTGVRGFGMMRGIHGRGQVPCRSSGALARKDSGWRPMPDFRVASGMAGFRCIRVFLSGDAVSSAIRERARFSYITSGTPS